MHADRYDQLVEEFLSRKRIAIWGMEDAKSDPAHLVARKLRKQGIEVIAVNLPSCWARLKKATPGIPASPTTIALTRVDEDNSFTAARCVSHRLRRGFHARMVKPSGERAVGNRDTRGQILPRACVLRAEFGNGA